MFRVVNCIILLFIYRQRIYTRLPGGSPRIKMVIYTAALQDPQPNRLYTRLPVVNAHKIAIYTAAVPEPIQIYTRQPCIYPLPHEVAIYTAVIQDSSWLYTLLPGV